MSIIPHDFNGKAIEQADCDTDINGVTIPKGYVNLSQLARAGKKPLKNYWRLAGTLDYVIALSEGLEAESYIRQGAHICAPDNHAGLSDSLSFGISSGLLIYTKNSIGGDADIYCHFEMAIEVARWISPEFNVWANRTLRLVINGEFKALTAEAEQAQKELTKRWAKIRSSGIVTRRELTDSIKDWYDRPDTSTSCDLGMVIKLCTNKLYQALWGVNAADIRSHFGLTKDYQRTRDSLSEKALKALEFGEAKVIECIDDDNATPHKNAVEIARIRPAKVSFKD